MAISKAMRAHVLQRDGGRCQLCGAQAPDKPMEVDHRVPESLGGAATLDNLWTLCRDCNRGKGSSYLEPYVDARRAERIAVPGTRPRIDPPVAYQVFALEQITTELERKGVAELTVPQLAALLPDVLLRDGVDPTFEPLSYPVVEAGIHQLIQRGRIQVDGERVTIYPVAEARSD